MWDGVDEDDELVLYAFQRPGPGVGARAVGCQCRLYYTRSDGEKVWVCQGLDIHPAKMGVTFKGWEYRHIVRMLRALDTRRTQGCDVPAETVYYRAQAAMKGALIASLIALLLPSKS